MKTLILNGSPRKNGDTAFMISELIKGISGEYLLFDCFGADVSPCTDCRACRRLSHCAIDDDMSRLYGFIADCDRVVIASPVHYAGLSAPLLTVASRFQVYSSAAIFRSEKLLSHKQRKGAVLLAQGGSGGADRAYDSAKLILRSLEVPESSIFPMICSPCTDKVSAKEDAAAIAQISALCRRLCE